MSYLSLTTTVLTFQPSKLFICLSAERIAMKLHCETPRLNNTF